MKKYSALLLAATLTLSGCSSDISSISGSDAPADDSSQAASAADKSAKSPKTGEYTADDFIKAAEDSPLHSDKVSSRSGDDISDDAVRVYNNLMRYAASYLRDTGFCIYDFYATHSEDNALTGYVLKIVLDDCADSGDHENAPVTLMSNSDGGRIKSNLAGFRYARRWTEDLSDEINDKYPNYHLSTFCLTSEKVFLSIDRGEETYNLANIGREPMTGDWSVNLILPVGTAKDEFKKAYADIQPILKDFSVSQVTVLAPDSKESLENMIAGEKITDNCYYYIEEGFAWREIIDDINSDMTEE